jgi:hypothetical protein
LADPKEQIPTYRIQLPTQAVEDQATMQTRRVYLDIVTQKLSTLHQGQEQLAREPASVKQEMERLAHRLENITQRMKPEERGYETNLCLHDIELLPPQPAMVLSAVGGTVPAQHALPAQHAMPREQPAPPAQSVQKMSTPRPPRKGRWRRRLAVFTVETGYLGIALGLAYAIWIYLAPWPIYRIVAYVILVILWSNFASTAARHTSTKRQAVEIVNAVKHATTKHKALTPQEVLKADTTMYLQALKVDLQEKRRLP